MIEIRQVLRDNPPLYIDHDKKIAQWIHIPTWYTDFKDIKTNSWRYDQHKHRNWDKILIKWEE